MDMIVIKSFSGPAREAVAIERFAITVAEKPAFMIELFRNNYHIYGDRPGTENGIMRVIANIHKAMHLPFTKANFALDFYGADGVCEGHNELTATEVAHLMKSLGTGYVAVTTSGFVLWADIHIDCGRFGVALSAQFPKEEPSFLRELTRATVSDADLGEIASFLGERTGLYQSPCFFRGLPEPRLATLEG